MAVKKRNLVVKVDVDAALKRLYTEALKRLEVATAEGAQSWDRRYEAIADILEHNPPMYLAGGYSTEAAFLTKQIGENRQAVYRNIRVAKYANADDIEKYTPSRLDLAITFVETKNHGPLKGRTPIDFAKLHFPFKQGDTLVSKTLAEITVAELHDAIAHLKGREASSHKASPVAKALDASIKKAGVKGVKVSLTKQSVTLRLPVEAIAKVAKALVGFKPPAT